MNSIRGDEDDDSEEQDLENFSKYSRYHGMFGHSGNEDDIPSKQTPNTVQESEVIRPLS